MGGTRCSFPAPSPLPPNCYRHLLPPPPSSPLLSPPLPCPPPPPISSILPPQVVEIAPRLGVLEQLLSQRPYGLQDEAGEGERADGGPMETEDATGAADGRGEEGRQARPASWGLYSFEELLARVQVGGGGGLQQQGFWSRGGGGSCWPGCR